MIQQTSTEVQFPLNILKNLVDKNDQKRQSACKNLQIIVNKNAQRKKHQQIQKIIEFFKQKYVKTNDNNKKKVGLDVLVSIVSGIKDYSDASYKFTPIIVGIILDCLNDTQHKIRFTALKALYYISKALDQNILPMFNQIFEQIMGKTTDLDDQVKSAAKFLDSALKTILTSSLSANSDRVHHKDFDLNQFMEILTSKFKSQNPTIRLFLIEWINTLNQMATIDLIIYLPDILQDLLFMLGDKQKTLRTSAKSCLGNFEKQLEQKFNQGKLESVMNQDTINNILSILIKVAKGKSSSHTKLIALVWFNLMFKFFKAQIQNTNQQLANSPQKNALISSNKSIGSKQSNSEKVKMISKKMSLKKIIIQRFDEVLEPILLLMSHEEQEVRKVSLSTNDLLMQNIQMINKQERINFQKVMPLLKEMLSEKKSSSTSETVLRWMKFMLENYNDKILPQINDIIQKLVQKLCDANNTKNVISIIESTTVTGEYFDLLIEKMLVLLFNNFINKTAQDKPQQILRRFCSVLDPNRFCHTLCAKIAQTFDDRNFIFEIVHYLNYIIITDKSMMKVRKTLQNQILIMEGSPQKNKEFFMTLFQAFKYNPSALTSLCLLAKQYQLAYEVILTLGKEREATNTILSGYCKLASLIQSPGFLYLRLEILDKNQHPFLGEALCALLMILPQGKIFNLLKSRLEVSKFMPKGLKPTRKTLKSEERFQMKQQGQRSQQKCLQQFNYIQDQFYKSEKP